MDEDNEEVSLLDILPAAGLVEIGGKKVKVTGIDATVFRDLIARFPPIAAMLVERKADAGAIMAMGPEIVAAIVAAGCGKLGDAKYEEKAARQPIGVQIDFVAKIIALTSPNGVRPFVELAAAFGVNLAGLGRDQDTSSDLPSSS